MPRFFVITVIVVTLCAIATIVVAGGGEVLGARFAAS